MAAYFGPMRNSEGYMDPTAGDAMKEAAKTMTAPSTRLPLAGEIWSTKDGLEMLIVAPHDWFSTCFVLVDDARKPFRVSSRAVKYTDPAQVSYVKHLNLGEFVKTVPQAELEEIRRQCITAMGGGTDQQAEKLVKQLTAEADSLRDKLDDTVTMLSKVSAENVQLKADLAAAQHGGGDQWRMMYEHLLDRVLRANG